MKNRSVLARLAALGMSIVLCFGVVACGEKEESSGRGRTEKEADEEEEKEEESKDDENKEDGNKESEEKKVSDEKKQSGSGKEEARQNAGKEAAAANEKEERTPAVADGKIEGHYVASVDVGEEYFMEQMDLQGNGDVAEAFRGADFSFDVTLDLKEDNTGVMGFDMESFIGHFVDFLDEHFVEVMIASMESQGTSKEDMLAQAKQAGYDNLEDFLVDYKDMYMGIFEKAMRNGAESAGETTLDLTWEEKGDQIAIKANRETLMMDIGSDGSLTIVLPADQSPTQSDIEMVFMKQ